MIGVDALKQKFFEPLFQVAQVFTMPRDSTITSLIAAMLLKLSGNNQVVAYFFKKWQMYV